MPDSGLPRGWALRRFTDFADVNPRRSLRAGVSAPFVEMASVREGFRGVAHVAERLANGSGAKFQNGDTIFARITPCAENGKVACVDFLSDGAVGFGSTEFIVFGPRDGEVNSRYLYHLVSSAPIHSGAISQMRGSSGRQRVPDDFFREGLTVAVPPTPEQARIADVLDSIDGAIERTEAVIEATERLRAALLGELLTRGVPGWHTEWKQVPGIGTIPACWEVVRLGDCGKWLSGGTPSKSRADFWSGPVPWVSPKDMKFRIIFDAEDHISQEAAAELRCVGPGTILVVVRGMILAHSFPVALTSREVAFNQDLRALVCRTGIVPGFLLAYLESRRDSLVRLATPSTHGTMRIVSEELFDVQMPKASEQEQGRICEAMEALDQRISIERHSLRGLTTLKPAIAEALLSGRVRVGGRR